MANDTKLLLLLCLVGFSLMIGLHEQCIAQSQDASQLKRLIDLNDAYVKSLQSGVIVAEIQSEDGKKETWKFVFDPLRTLSIASTNKGGKRILATDHGSKRQTSIDIPDGIDESKVNVYNQGGMFAAETPSEIANAHLKIPWILMWRFRRNATSQDYSLKELCDSGTFVALETGAKANDEELSVKFPDLEPSGLSEGEDIAIITLAQTKGWCATEVKVIDRYPSGEYPEVGMNFATENFKKINGIWLPSRVTLTVSQAGKPLPAGWNAVLSYELINEPIPETYFDLPVPDGTLIWSVNGDSASAKLIDSNGDVKKTFKSPDEVSEYRELRAREDGVALPSGAANTNAFWIRATLTAAMFALASLTVYFIKQRKPK